MSEYVNNEFICEFCGKEYSSLNSLLTHKKTAKFCLNIQNKVADNIDSLRCDSCNKVFTTKHTFSTHTSNCKEKMVKTITMLNDTIRELTKQLSDVTSRNTYLEKDNKKLKAECDKYRNHLMEKDKQRQPTTVINNTTMNTTTHNTYNMQYNQLLSTIKPFTPESINDTFNEISHETLVNVDIGCETILEKEVGNSISKLLFFVDHARRIIVVKDADGKGTKYPATEIINQCLDTANPVLLDKVTKSEKHMNDLFNNDQLPEDKIDFINKNIKLTKSLFNNGEEEKEKEKARELKKRKTNFKKKIVNYVINNGKTLNKGMSG